MKVNGKMIKRIVRGAVGFILAFVLVFALHTAVNCLFGFCDRLQNSDLIVVYGNKVNADGTLSRRLKLRLDKAIEVYAKGYSHLIVVTGGIDPNGNDEAAVMKQYLVANGNIPADRIIEDNGGINTRHSVLFVRDFMEQNGLESVMNVSQYSHLMRIHLAMKKAGIKKINRAHAEWFFEPRNFYTAFREFAAFYYYLVKY